MEGMKHYKGKLFRDILEQSGFTVAYDGDMKDGKPEGYGRAFYRDGRIYEGEWKAAYLMVRVNWNMPRFEALGGDASFTHRRLAGHG